MREIRLTEGQVRVLSLIAQGFTQKEAARTLFMSPRTVESHIESARKASGTRNCVDLCVYAAMQGQLSPDVYVAMRGGE